MRINHNLASLNTYRQLTVNNSNTSKSLEKLSSGSRINRAGDDAAGLAISEKMRAQIRGLDMASKNAQDSISLIQTAEGALNETQSILQRMRELAVQASNDTNVSIDRSQIQKEINQLTSEVNRIGNTTEFNTMTLLNGGLASSKLVGAASSKVEYKQVSKEYTVNFADAVSGNAFAKYASAIEGGAISVSGTGEFSKYLEANTKKTSASSFVEIKKTSAGFTVTLIAQMSGAATVFSSQDTLTANASGDFVYDHHGVKFTIKKDSADKLSNNDAIKVGTQKSESSISVKNDWNTNDSTATKTIFVGNKITVDASKADSIKNAVMLSVTVTASGKMTVSYYDISSGGTAIHKDYYDNTAQGTSDFDYDDHGVKFTLKTGTANATIGIKLTRSETKTDTSTYVDNSLKFQVGANENQTIALGIEDMRALKLGITSSAVGTNFTATKGVTDGTNNTAAEFALSVSSSGTAANAITVLNKAINTVSEERSKLGSVQNRLEHTINNLGTTSENLTASESRIRDVDMAKEMMEFTKNNILTQAAQSMLAQANQQPQGVLQLLR